MTDIGDTIAPKSNQMNADDLVAGPLTLTITEVRVHDTGDQPVHVFFAEWPTGRPWKPSLGMRRWLIAVWGAKSVEYVGKRITLYRDDSVTWAGEAIGGIRIGAMSGIDSPRKLPLTLSSKQKVLITIRPIADTAPTSPPVDETTVARNAVLAQIKDAATAANVGLDTIAAEWAESHDGQDIREATDIGGLELVRDDIAGRVS